MNFETKLLESEQKEYDRVLPGLYGYHLLQVGQLGLADCLQSSLIKHKININKDLSAYPDQLSILTDSIDVVVLTHALERAVKNKYNPHQILREAHRVLMPGGHIIISGFNPYSFLGLKYLLWDERKKLLSLSKLKDWLVLLDLEIVEQRFFGPAYDAYIIVAIKRITPLTLIKAIWQNPLLSSWAQGEGAS